MKLILPDNLKCRCGNECISLHDVWLQDDYYGYGPFTLYIYFKCSFCADIFRYAHKRDQKRLKINQGHVNRAIRLNPNQYSKGGSAQ